jgi:hypothetical protein
MSVRRVPCGNAGGIEFPDEFLANNAFRDIDTFAKTIQNLLPKGRAGMFKNIKFIHEKNFKYKEIDESVSANNQVIHIKGGIISLLSSLVAMPLSAFIIYNIARNYSTFFLEVLEMGKKEVISLLIIACMVAIIITPIIHEFFHYLALPISSKRKFITYFVLSYPIGIGVVNYDIRTKWREAWFALSPVVLLSIICLLFLLLIGNPILSLFLSFILTVNIASSVADVVRAMCIILQAPAKSKIFLGYILIPTKTSI